MIQTKTIFILLFISSLVSCGLYAIMSEPVFYKNPTISVSRIKNNIKTHSPTIDYKITEELQNKLNRQDDLELVEKEGDLQMNGSITDYHIKPFSIGSNYKAHLNRVTITLNVSLLNQTDNNKVITKKIATFVDFDAKYNFGGIKDSLNDVLSEKVANEIYNEFFIRW